MSKRTLIGIAVVALILIGGALGVTLNTRTAISDGKFSVSDRNDAFFDARKTACELLTDDIAKQVLGSRATKGELPNASADVPGVQITQCIYQDGTAKIDTQSATLQVRAAVSEKGAGANLFGYSQTKAQKATESSESGYEVIENLGQEGSWNSSLGQVNVLIDDGAYWLVITVTKGADKFDRDKAVELARLIAKQLQ